MATDNNWRFYALKIPDELNQEVDNLSRNRDGSDYMMNKNLFRDLS